jgi:hypothetical protein
LAKERSLSCRRDERRAAHDFGSQSGFPMRKALK